jgi:omega-amidase
MQDLKIGLVQMDPAWEDQAANLEKALRLIHSIRGKVDLVALPEMFTTGFTRNASACSQDFNGTSLQWLKEKAQSINADIAGSIIIADRGRYYNRLVWAKPDGTIMHYDKRHLFRMAGEHATYACGSSNITVELNGWRIRPFICYDLRFPVWTRNRANEYHIALFVASWPAKRSAHWAALLKARAIENLCYVVGVNRTGTDGNGVEYAGGSLALDFAGNIICDAGSSESVAIVRLKSAPLLQYRESFPAWMDADSFSIET